MSENKFKSKISRENIRTENFREKNLNPNAFVSKFRLLKILLRKFWSLKFLTERLSAPKFIEETSELKIQEQKKILEHKIQKDPFTKKKNLI